ncbi:MAG: dynamin family protein [candidate division WOR-3 bacterium]
MFDLDSYNKEKFRIIESIKSYISDLKRCQEISNSVNLPLNFDESIQKLEGVIKSLIDDKVRVSVIAEVSNGKSSFLNALIFKDRILEARVGETTARLYHISYGENYAVKYKNSEKKFNNLEEIKEFIRQLNEETLAKAEQSKEGGKVLNISEDELSVFIYMPLENLKAGIEVIDTPGFGTLNEELMKKFIQSAINLSDAVITILDISQGITIDEIEKLSRLLSMIRPDKRYIVFNKIDAYEEEEESNFDLIGKGVINKMNDILSEQGYSQKIDVEQLFYISAKLALQGFIKQAKGEEIDERTKRYKKLFEDFERVFWNDVINYKQKEFLSSKVSSFERTKEFINKEVNSIYKNLSNQLLSLKSEKESILREQNKINTMAQSLQQKASGYIENLKGIKLNTDEIIQKVGEKILQESAVISYVEENYNVFSSLFSADEIQQEINQRLSEIDIGKILDDVFQNYYGPIFSNIRKYVEDYNKSVDEFNSELEKMNIERFRFPKIDYQQKKIEEKHIASQIEVVSGDIFGSLLSGVMAGFTVGMLVRAIALEFIGTNAAIWAGSEAIAGAIAGPIGILAGLVWTIFDLLANVEKKKQELKQRIIEGVYTSLYDLREDINKLNDILTDFIDNIRIKFNEVKFISSEIIKMLEKGDLDERIKEIETQLNAIKSISELLETKLREEV